MKRAVLLFLRRFWRGLRLWNIRNTRHYRDHWKEYQW